MPDGPDHPETWVFHLAMAWLGNPDHSLSYEERLAMIKERAKELGEPARSAFTWIPSDTLVHKADVSYWITQPWDNHAGRMTLAGDAAHPMPPCESAVFTHFLNLPLILWPPINRPRPRPQPLHLRRFAPPRRHLLHLKQQIHIICRHKRVRRRSRASRQRRGQMLRREWLHAS